MPEKRCRTIKESTRRLFKKHGWRIDRSIHNYLYFVFYYPYVKTALVSGRFITKYFSWLKPLGRIWRAVFERYHGKVVSLQDTEKILSVRENIRATSEENKRIIPFKFAYKIILQEPEYIAVMDCPCKKATGAPEDTIRSCIAVGRDIAEFWLENCQKYHPVRITQAEALDLVKRLREEGHINQAFFKVATGGSSVGVLCNCRADTCVSLIATRLTQKFHPTISQVAESGYSVRREGEKCIRCGTCAEVCPFGAARARDGTLDYIKDICMGCGLCVEKCPEGILTMYLDREKPLPLDIDLVRERFVDR